MKDYQHYFEENDEETRYYWSEVGDDPQDWIDPSDGPLTAGEVLAFLTRTDPTITDTKAHTPARLSFTDDRPREFVASIPDATVAEDGTVRYTWESTNTPGVTFATDPDARMTAEEALAHVVESMEAVTDGEILSPTVITAIRAGQRFSYQAVGQPAARAVVEVTVQATLLLERDVIRPNGQLWAPDWEKFTSRIAQNVRFDILNGDESYEHHGLLQQIDGTEQVTVEPVGEVSSRFSTGELETLLVTARDLWMAAPPEGLSARQVELLDRLLEVEQSPEGLAAPQVDPSAGVAAPTSDAQSLPEGVAWPTPEPMNPGGARVPARPAPAPPAAAAPPAPAPGR